MTALSIGRALLGWYLEANALLAFGWVALAILVRLGTGTGRLADWSALGQASRVLLVVALVGPPLASLLPRHDFFPAVTELWHPTPRWDSAHPSAAALAILRSMPPAARVPVDAPPPWRSPTALVLALLFATILGRGAYAWRNWHQLRALLGDSLLWRRQGRLRILVSSATSVPFSYRACRAAFVVLPESLLSDAEAWRIALRHEAQHHRHGDTVWLHLLEWLQILFVWNPCARLWTRTCAELQEYVCDEALIAAPRARSLTAHAYGSCLVRVGEAAAAAQSRASFLAGSSPRAPIASLAHGSGSRAKLMLERRLLVLETTFKRRARPLGRRLTLAVSALLAGATCTLAYAARGTHVKAGLTLDEGRALVKAMEPIPNFPIVMNDAVLGRLNYFLTQPGRSDFVKGALQRMEAHRPMIEDRLERHRLPEALLAVPLVESGYQNMVQKPGRTDAGGPMGAGLWMFIKGTARNYGLKVDGKFDQRLDARRETDAAVRYLGANYSRYKDWMLALAAYNMGETAVDRALEDAGHRDAWRLVDSGQINDYIVYVMAGVILMKNPSLLE